MSQTWECGVCWNVYDPSVGDRVAQVAAGTPFEALPEHWRCPQCDSDKGRYLKTKDTRVERLVADYVHIAETRMKGLPIVNQRLRVEALEFAEVPAGLLGLLVTPWSINAVLFPNEGRAPVDGHDRALPGGQYRFLPQTLREAGFVELSSLFSPVTEFASQEAAIAAGRAAFEVLAKATAPVAGAPENKSEGPSRRDLLRAFRR